MVSAKRLTAEALPSTMRCHPRKAALFSLQGTMVDCTASRVEPCTSATSWSICFAPATERPTISRLTRWLTSAMLNAVSTPVRSDRSMVSCAFRVASIANSAVSSALPFPLVRRRVWVVLVAISGSSRLSVIRAR
jgi:hypothetical protein